MKIRTESGWLSVDVEFNLGVRGIDGEFELIEAFSTLRGGFWRRLGGGCRLFVGMKDGELTGLGEAMWTSLALLEGWGDLGLALLGDFRLGVGGFPGDFEDPVEDLGAVKLEDDGGDLILEGGARGDGGLRNLAGTFLFLFPRSKSVGPDICVLLRSELES